MSCVLIVSMMLVIALAALHAVALRRFLKLHRDRLAAPPRTVTHWPRLAVFMPVRGVDPFLKESIQSVVEQDYPHHQLHIIVDREDDAGAIEVARILRETPSDKVFVTPLRAPLPTCSLVCSALIQFLNEVEGHCEAVTFCATDQILPQGWLKRIASALDDPHVATPTGNRWYQPPSHSWGSLARYFWNAGAVLQMTLWQVPWGGAVCLRMDDIQRAQLKEKWSRSMVEDVVLRDGLEPLGLRMEYDPWLIALNREETTLRACLHFVSRQVLWAHRYHRHWASMAAYTLIASAIYVLGFSWGIGCLLAGQYLEGAAALAAQLVFNIVTVLMFWQIERSMRRAMILRGEAPHRWTVMQVLRFPGAVFLAHVMHLTAVLRAGWTRVVIWRGQRYELDRDGNVRMGDHTAYAQETPATSPMSVET